MKVTFSMKEVRQILKAAALRRNETSQFLSGDAKEVKFIHKYADGSGEADIETIGIVDRVEVEV